ncbi:MAG: type II toxin-antitoxin system RelE/ParE family toxin [Pirellulales bacterium]
MPPTEVRAFRQVDGRVPIQDWLNDLKARKPEAYEKCLARILELADLGHEMRRPHSDYLRDGIHELRAKLGRVQYRVLYFFYAQHQAALSHGLIKPGRAVPPREIDTAVARRNQVLKDPDRYTADIDLE